MDQEISFPFVFIALLFAAVSGNKPLHQPCLTLAYVRVLSGEGPVHGTFLSAETQDHFAILSTSLCFSQLGGCASQHCPAAGELAEPKEMAQWGIQSGAGEGGQHICASQVGEAVVLFRVMDRKKPGKRF